MKILTIVYFPLGIVFLLFKYRRYKRIRQKEIFKLARYNYSAMEVFILKTPSTFREWIHRVNHG